MLRNLGICDIAWIITMLTLGSELNHFCHQRFSRQQ